MLLIGKMAGKVEVWAIPGGQKKPAGGSGVILKVLSSRCFCLDLPSRFKPEATPERRQVYPLRGCYFAFFFGSHWHWLDGLPHPAQTPFLISPPQTLHGVHPHVWHMKRSFRGCLVATSVLST